MTATVSTNKKAGKINPPLHNWKSNIKESRKMAIIITILHLVAAPAVLIAMIVSIYMGHRTDDAEIYLVIGICTTCLAAFLGIFTAVDSFRCLHDKSVVDMKLSVPLNNTQRFFSNLLSGLFTYLAPFLAAQVISLLLCGYGCLFMDGKTFYYERYSGGDVLVDEPYVCDMFGLVLPILLKLIAGGTLCMLMLYAVTVFITVCCGNKFEAIAYTILINILIPLTIYSVSYSMFESLYGITSEEIALKFMTYISVVGGIIASIDWAADGELYYQGFINHGIWALVFSLVIIAFLALSFFLYRKRRAEQVSKPFVFKLVYYVLVTCGMFCIISLYLTEFDDIIPAIIMSGIVYLIFEVVTNRGFKRFWLSIIKYAVTFGAVVAVVFIGEETEGFGAVQRVPSVSAVKSVELDYCGFYEDFYCRYWGDVDQSIGVSTFKEKENIETIINAHQAIIDNYNENRNYNDLTNNVTNNSLVITYNLKTGGSFTRTYYSYSAKPAEILTAIDVSKEFKMQVAEKYKKHILNVKKEIEVILEKHKDDYTYHRFEEGISVYNSLRLSGPGVSLKPLLEREFFEQLAEAYYKDIMAITDENYFRSELKNVWQVSIHYSYGSLDLLVPESFTNTVELLEYFDLGLVHIENVSDEILFNELVRKATVSEVLLLTDKERKELYSVPDEITLHATYARTNYYNNDNCEAIVYDFDKNFYDLLRAAMPRNIVQENGYVICVPGFTGVIPEEMNSVASSIPRSSHNKSKEAYYSQLCNNLDEDYYD